MVAVVGVDPSFNKMAAVYGVDDEQVDIDSVTLPGSNIADKAVQIHLWLTDLLAGIEDEDIHVFIEEPVIGRGGAYSTLSQAKAHGVMVLSALLSGAEVTTVNPARWKKVVLGKGNLGKPEIKKAMSEKWPSLVHITQGDQDLVDAAAIYLYGKHVLELRQRVSDGEYAQKTPVRRRRIT